MRWKYVSGWIFIGTRPNLNHEIRLRAQNTEGNRMFQQQEDSSSHPFDNDIQLPNLNASKGNSTPYK